MSRVDASRGHARRNRQRVLAGASAVALMVWAGAAAAQDTSTVGEVVVTGSYIQRPVKDTPNPVSVLGSDELQKQSVLTSDYLFKNLPMANGARSTPDNTNAPYQLGMANINLRGLGVASTLTLVNGRRQVVSPVPLDDGSSFVDINTIPLIMVDRVEILQNGGSGLYGSDAVAGVANFVMRKRFEGLELRAQYQSTFKDSQEDINLGVVGGLSGDNWDFVAGIEGLYRTPLAQNDRPFAAHKIRSALGFPGAFRPLTAALPTIDPNCARLGGIPTPFVPNTNLGLCGSDLSEAFKLISPEQRILGYATAEYRPSDNHTLYAELGIAHNEAKLFSSPSYSNLTFPVIPANNPGNLVANGGFGVPVVFYGRPLMYINYPANEQRRRSDMVRAVAGARGESFIDGWRYDASYTFAQQLYSPTNIRDTLEDRFNAALNGVGGPNNNQFFNPFGSSITNPALANDPRVIDDFTADSWRKYKGRMHSVEGVLTGDLFDLPAGKVAAAVGAQFRHESLDFASDRDQQTGNFIFLFSGPDFEISQKVWAVFGELAVPIAENLDLQLQARYDHYSRVGGNFSPQAALRWEPLDSLVIRASAGTSFRAPSLSQISSISTINNAVVDPFNPSLIPFFTQILTVPGSELEPETAKNFGLGAIWNPHSQLSFTLDYWRYDYEDLIVKESFQAIVSANPNDPRITRAGGDPRGLIQQVRVSFVNQNSVVADGIDFSATANQEYELGRLDLTLRGTYLNKYETTIAGRKQDISGKRNFENFARSLPKLRLSAIGSFAAGPHTFTTTVNYISAYEENFTAPGNAFEGYEYDALATLDLQYQLSLDAWDADIAVGVINATDQYPHSSVISSDLQGFDRFVYDPRGRLGYVRVSKRF